MKKPTSDKSSIKHTIIKVLGITVLVFLMLVSITSSCIIYKCSERRQQQFL